MSKYKGRPGTVRTNLSEPHWPQHASELRIMKEKNPITSSLVQLYSKMTSTFNLEMHLYRSYVIWLFKLKLHY